jgi:hypothetical protein
MLGAGTLVVAERREPRAQQETLHFSNGWLVAPTDSRCSVAVVRHPTKLGAATARADDLPERIVKSVAALATVPCAEKEDVQGILGAARFAGSVAADPKHAVRAAEQARVGTDAVSDVG